MSDFPVFPLQPIISHKIADSRHQRITFAEYMELALYHPQYGYYNSETIEIGTQGDFFTSPSLGKDFGEFLGIQFVQMWEILGNPSPFQLVEMGAGEGILAANILACLAREYPDFFGSLEYIIIERSPRLMKRQKSRLRQQGGHLKAKVQWHDWESMPNDSIIGCCFSNELIDAFPVHKIQISNGNLEEIYVAERQGILQEEVGNISSEKIAEYFELIEIDFTSKNYPNNYQSEVNLAALDWLRQVAQKLKQGYLLTIDYGYGAGKYYHPQRSRGTLKCYYQHRHHDNPFVNIGHQDITAHVNFTALEKQGELFGLETLGLIPQAIFLMALGLGDRLYSLVDANLPLEVMLERRDYLHQLINPTGLGGFQVLLQAKGLMASQQKIQLKGLSAPYNSAMRI